MSKATIVCAVLGMCLAVSSTAFATSVLLVPDRLNVAPGETVNVSIDVSVDSPGFNMAAISVAIKYDSAVFTYVDPVVQGAFLGSSLFSVGGFVDAGGVFVRT